MSPVSGVPASCQDRCPLEALPENLIVDYPFTKRCNGPVMVTDTPVDNEFDIENSGYVERVTQDSRKIGARACTNNGVAIYLDKIASGEGK